MYIYMYIYIYIYLYIYKLLSELLYLHYINKGNKIRKTSKVKFYHIKS